MQANNPSPLVCIRIMYTEAVPDNDGKPYGNSVVRNQKVFSKLS